MNYNTIPTLLALLLLSSCGLSDTKLRYFDDEPDDESDNASISSMAVNPPTYEPVIKTRQDAVNAIIRFCARRGWEEGTMVEACRFFDTALQRLKGCNRTLEKKLKLAVKYALYRTQSGQEKQSNMFFSLLINNVQEEEATQLVDRIYAGYGKSQAWKNLFLDLLYLGNTAKYSEATANKLDALSRVERLRGIFITYCKRLLKTKALANNPQKSAEIAQYIVEMNEQAKEKLKPSDRWCKLFLNGLEKYEYAISIAAVFANAQVGRVNHKENQFLVQLLETDKISLKESRKLSERLSNKNDKWKENFLKLIKVGCDTGLAEVATDNSFAS